MSPLDEARARANAMETLLNGMDDYEAAYAIAFTIIWFGHRVGNAEAAGAMVMEAMGRLINRGKGRAQ